MRDGASEGRADERAANAVVDWRRVAVVTAADAAYARFAAGLLRSLRAAETGIGGARFQVHVIDLGLGQAEHTMLAPLGNIVTPSAPLPIEMPAPMRAFLLARMVKPFLPRLVPGFDTYVWLDADAWVQLPTALPLLVTAARSVGVAAVPEIDAAYTFLFDADSPQRLTVAKRYLENCSRRDARRLFTLPAINSGVVAAQAGSPLWAAWQARIADAFGRVRRAALTSDQAAFNAALYLDRVPFRTMSAVFNWLVSGAPPLIDRTDLLCTPLQPRQRIQICHLTTPAMDAMLAVSRVDGGREGMALDFDAFTAWRRAKLRRGAPR
ncbi:MAG: hypothetical protein AB7P02_02725 [Alphaproteobacteria bacterium]